MEEEFSRLVRDGKRGDPAALATLYQKYLQGVLRAARRRLRGSLRRCFDTLDIGHSVFLEVLRDLPRFEDRGEAAFRRWLAIKAGSVIHTKLRKMLRQDGARREVTLDMEAALGPLSRESSPFSRVIRDEEDARLEAALFEIEDSYRRILLLRHEESLGFAEAAACMNLPSPDAARKLYARALARLRDRWKSA